MTAVPLPERPPRRARRATSTSSFGSSRRESHDASAFYRRFVPPTISAATSVAPPREVDVIHAADARDMTAVAPDSVALVVTSPPYFAGKEYEEALGRDGVPASYLEYLDLLAAVFEECARVLEPGGRIAVNIANLGRRPYRSLASDVIGILQDLGLLLRGEVVWWKGRAAGGSCAWGTFQRPGNPVLRDVTERVVIASKGRFDRALTAPQRRERGLPSTATITRDEFLEATTDLWELPAESATRVGHPAPFPVELPQRLIELYTYLGDVVLDPFMGSGSTAVAAVRTARHFVGFETDRRYVERAHERVAEERARLAGVADAADEGGGTGAAAGRALGAGPLRVELPAVTGPDDGSPGHARAAREGRQAREVAEALLDDCGFVDVRADVRLPAVGVEVSFTARDATGGEWAFDVCGAFTAARTGLRRADTLWKALGKAAVVHAAHPRLPLVLLTTDLPQTRSPGDLALGVVLGPGRPVFDVVELLAAGAEERLRAHARTGRPPVPPLPAGRGTPR